MMEQVLTMRQLKRRQLLIMKRMLQYSFIRDYKVLKQGIKTKQLPEANCTVDNLAIKSGLYTTFISNYTYLFRVVV